MPVTYNSSYYYSTGTTTNPDGFTWYQELQPVTYDEVQELLDKINSYRPKKKIKYDDKEAI